MATRVNSRTVMIIDHVPEVLQAIRILTDQEVLVGFPESTNGRDDEEGEAITNARLGYIHETGSPLTNLPARPFLVPGVAKATDQEVEALQIAAEASLDGDTGKMNQALSAAGQIGAASAKREISTAEFAPLSPSTVWHRRFSRRTKTMRPGEIKYFKLLDQGMSPKDAQDAVGIQPLINTGQLRNAITSVVRKRT